MEMKTIEEKARAYDKAIEHAKLLLKTIGNATLGNLVLKNEFENMFSELKESEDENTDEKVRKALIKLTTNYASMDLFIEYDIHLDEVLSWLEKQRDKDKLIQELGEYKVKYTQEVLSQHLEKQGEQKQDVNMRINPSEYINDMGGNGCYLKFTDKIEPKFKVGDWIVYNRDNYSREIIQVYDIRDDRYYFTDNVHLSWSIKECDEKSHLWTIQDAKNGDVLAVEAIEENYQYPFVAIYKERGLNFFNSYCSIGFNGKFHEADTGHLTKEIHPATKEQRDLLFQKMKEAGYDWDSKKKELKKLEQKQVIDYPDNLQKDNWELVHEFIEEFGRMPKDEDELNVLVEYVLNRKKLAWSEEDEETFSYLEDVVDFCYRNQYVVNVQTCERVRQLVFRLKSLCFQSKWSKDDITRIDEIIETLNIVQANRVRTQRMHYNKATIDKNIDWLKSLKDRYTWKPSNEQIHYLSWIANVKLGDSMVEQEVSKHLNELLEDLKKLREE